MKISQLHHSRTAKIRRLIWQVRRSIFPLIKRFVDVIVSASLLMLFSPLLVLIAALIKCESSGGPLFSQTRIGLNGRPFTMWKFRSMYNNAEASRQDLEFLNEMPVGVTFKMRRDPRITPLGALIRKYSIDELPQLINVFLGDMSLVGPRPALPSEVSEYSRFDKQRLSVVPGLTCIWQISGRSDIPFDQQVKLDIQYIEKQTLSFDILILLKTIPAVLKARGAY